VLLRPEIQGLINMLKVPSMPLKVEALKPVGDLNGTYDLVTGLRTRFHSTKPKETGLDAETHWGVREWDFFLKDIVTHINPGEQIFFMLNRLQEKEKGGGVPPVLLKGMTDDVMNSQLSWGGKVLEKIADFIERRGVRILRVSNNDGEYDNAFAFIAKEVKSVISHNIEL
jgi:hypothetical protein